MTKLRRFLSQPRTLIEARRNRQRPRCWYQPTAELMEARVLQSGLKAGVTLVETVLPSAAAHVVAVGPATTFSLDNHTSHGVYPAAGVIVVAHTSASMDITDATGGTQDASQPPSNDGDETAGEGGVVNTDPNGS